MRDLEQVALAFDAACREARVDYAFVGGVAVLAWGQPRTTMDVDALVRLREAQSVPFVRALAAHGLALKPEDLADAMRERSHATAFDTGSAIHVDLKMANTVEERLEVERAQEIAFPPGRLRVARAEDVVAYKLLFGSPQDISDARSILVRQRGKIDLDHLRNTCRQLKVAPALNRLIREIDHKTA